ncbi:MAG: chalcone isomerase family protein [Azonexus sp.]|nr:chalcone isomerase family protein [Azonexus sp.]
MNHSLRTAALLAALLAAPGLYAAEVAGIRMADTLRVGNQDLVLNGAGLRSKLFIKVYVGALYVDRRQGSAATLLEVNGPRRMQMRMLRDVDADSLQAALDDGLADNLSPDELAGLKPQIAQLSGIMRGIGKAREGDTIAIDFLPDTLKVALNGAPRGEVAGAALPPALLKVWLGHKPVDASLKKALLGQ